MFKQETLFFPRLFHFIDLLVLTSEMEKILLVDIGNDVIIVISQSWILAWLTRPTSMALIGLGSPQSASENTLFSSYASHDRKAL